MSEQKGKHLGKHYYQEVNLGRIGKAVFIRTRSSLNGKEKIVDGTVLGEIGDGFIVQLPDALHVFPTHVVHFGEQKGTKANEEVK